MVAAWNGSGPGRIERRLEREFPAVTSHGRYSLIELGLANDQPCSASGDKFAEPLDEGLLGELLARKGTHRREESREEGAHDGGDQGEPLRQEQRDDVALDEAEIFDRARRTRPRARRAAPS